MIARAAEEEEANMFFRFVTSDDIQKLEAEKERYVERHIFRERTRERERKTVNTLIQTRAKITTF